MAHVIAVLPIGRISPEDVALVTSSLVKAFIAEVIVAPAMRLPAHARASDRDQYLARAILSALTPLKRSGWSRLLGIVAEDLYAPGLNFVFGEADPERGVAVFSLARLREGIDAKSANGDSRFRRRVAAEAIHELGHTYGLGHCPDRHCVMWLSNTLAETDRKGIEFCPTHQTELAARMQ
jgi:archaemetzincin